jgi:flavodoxin
MIYPKHSIILLLSLLTVFAGCGKEQPIDEGESGQEEPTAQVQDGKVLVACFSFTGTTKTAATTLAGLTEGTLYLIEPEMPYGSENSNYYDESTRAYQEQYGPASARPAIKKTLQEADGYDIVLLGFPIWYGKAPRVVFSFLDTYSFKGKTVIPFITSGSTGISSAASELKSAYPDISWKTGDRLNGKTSAQLKSWLGSLGIKVK